MKQQIESMMKGFNSSFSLQKQLTFYNRMQLLIIVRWEKRKEGFGY